MQVAVETYGGGIWHSWFDRDLSLAGRVVIADNSGSFTSKLIKIDRPLLRIPTLAIHCKVSSIFVVFILIFVVDRDVNTSFKFNQETEFVPIIGQRFRAETIKTWIDLFDLSGLIESQLNDVKTNQKITPASSIQNNHHPALLSLLADHLSVVPEEIHDFEL